MKIFIIAGYLIVLVLQNVNAQWVICPKSDPGLLQCSSYTKPGQILDSNGCLIWKCVPNQPYCCPGTKDDIECATELQPTLIMDLKTGCNITTCAPKQPTCCPQTYPTRKCSKDSQGNFQGLFQVYDRKTGCLYWTCVPLCETPMRTTVCPNGFKPGQIYESPAKCLSWTCVPEQPICCRPTSPDTIRCTADSEPGKVMDPSTGCKYWQCIPKQPYCCERYPLEKCLISLTNVQIYDEKTGCYVWKCAPAFILYSLL